jgi:heptosyltransferase II
MPSTNVFRKPTSVICRPDVAEVFRDIPGVRDIILFDKQNRSHAPHVFSRFVRQLRDRHYTVAILPHRSFRSALMAWAAAIPRRIGFTRSQGRWFLTDRVPFEWGVHDVDRNLRLLTVFGGKQESQATFSLVPQAEARATIESRLATEGVVPGDLLLGVHAGSVWATKRWLPEGFAAVADAAAQNWNARVVFLGGAKDETLMQQILPKMKTKPLNWVGKTSLRELIAVIARCQAFLTNDSGPMHIAVACGVPTIAIFGPTTRELGFFPYGNGHTVIEKNLPCRPCGLHGANKCPLGHFECMKSITPVEVSAALRGVFEKAKIQTISR